MAKIDRYSGNMEAFAADALSTERTIFGDTAQSDTLDANITTDFLRGWGVVGVNENPTKQDFNGLAFTLGQLIAYLHQRGIAEWNTAQEYFDGSVVTTDVGVYRLKTGGDGSIDPDIDGGVNWELIPTQAKVDAKAAISGQAFSGNISAPNLSGTNTGDQTLSEIGVGQTWQDLSGSRSAGITYTNSTGKPINLFLVIEDGGNSGSTFSIDGISLTYGNLANLQNESISLVIPNGVQYGNLQLNGNNIRHWLELR